MTKIDRVTLNRIESCPRSGCHDAILTTQDGPEHWRFCLSHGEGPLLLHFQRNGAICCASPYAVSLLLFLSLKVRLASVLLQPCEPGGYVGVLHLEQGGTHADLRCTPAAAITLATICNAPLYVAMIKPLAEEEPKAWIDQLSPRDFG